MNSTPLPNFPLEDSKSTYSEKKSTQPLRGWFVEYTDKGYWKDDIIPNREKMQLTL